MTENNGIEKRRVMGMVERCTVFTRVDNRWRSQTLADHRQYCITMKDLKLI